MRLGAVLLGLTLLLSGQSASATARTLLGYYVPYDATSWASLEAHVDSLDLVAAQWVSIDACGNLSSQDDQTLIQFVHAHGLKVEPSLFTVAGWLNHQLLTDDATRANAIEQIVGYTLRDQYDGFDLDLEGVLPDDRQALTDFVRQLGDALHDQNKLLTLALPAKPGDTQTGWAGAYDYAALGAAADLVTIMAYEYRGPFSGPGSVAPYAWVQRVAAFATTQIAPEKVLLGLAFYGYDWNTTTGQARAIGYPQFVAIAEQYAVPAEFDNNQQSLTLAYQGDSGDPLPRPRAAPTQPLHQITNRQATPCAFETPAPSSPTAVPPELPPGTPVDHEVWVEDSASAAVRLQLVEQLHAAGAATWRLGLEDPAVWPLFDSWRSHP